MDIDSLALFAEVARRGSFSAVARERGVDPSSISRAIATLEAQLGTRLLHRSTRRVALTEAGRLYLDRIRPALVQLEEAREEVASVGGKAVGLVRLTASIAFGQLMLAPLLPAFRATLPRVQLELRLTDETVDLLGEGIDIALRLAPAQTPGFVGAKLFPTCYRVVAAPSWLEAQGRPGSPHDLSRVSCLLFALPEYRRRWLFRRARDTAEVAVSGDLVASSALMLREAALRGLGPALLADWMIGTDLGDGRLVDLFPDHDVTATTFDTAAWLLYPSREGLPRKVRATIDFLRRHLRGPS